MDFFDWIEYYTSKINERRAHIIVIHSREGMSDYVRSLLGFHAADVECLRVEKARQ